MAQKWGEGWLRRGLTTITKAPDRSFIFEPGGTQLKVDIVKPDAFDAKTEVNILTTPGRPGSVDKGEREERGVKMTLSTKQKVEKLDMIIKMQIERRN